MRRYEEPVFDEGIILKLTQYREKDIIYHALLKEKGRISLLMKGARGKKGQGLALDLGDIASMELVEGQPGFVILQNYKLTLLYKRIRESLESLELLSLLVEVADKLTVDGHESRTLFEPLSLGLRALEESVTLQEKLKASFLTLRAFTSLQGFLPENDCEIPSIKNFSHLLHRIENQLSAPIKSKPMLEEMFLALKKERS